MNKTSIKNIQTGIEKKCDILNKTVKIVSLQELLEEFPKMLKGQTYGRILVDVNK